MTLLTGNALADPSIKVGYAQGWQGLITGSYFDTADEACATFPGYWGSVTGIEFVDEARRICKYSNNYTFNLKLHCKPPGSSIYRFTGALCPEVDDDIDVCTAAGNPIVVSDGTKIQISSDWISPRENRFQFVRHYRSDQIMNGSPVSESFQNGWGSNWDIQLSIQDSALSGAVDEFMVHRADGRRYLFQGTGQMVPYRAGHQYALIDSDVNEGNRPNLSVGTGRIELYQSVGADIRKLEEIRWADGYVIQVTRDVNDRIYEVSDSRGQVARYTWDDTINTNTTIPAVIKIEIDTGYDGVTFSADLALNYTYAVPAVNESLLSLTAVSRTDIVGSTTDTIWEYDYSTDATLSLPIRLTSMRDGRLNSLGNPFDYASWTYQNKSNLSVTPVVPYLYTGLANRSEHFGGDGAVDLTFNPNGTVTQTNALGKDTTTEFAFIAGRYRPISVTGVAIASCLGTIKTVSYTPGAGEPEGYVYERTERNNARTVYTRDSRGLVLTKTEDTDGATPRITTYTWDATLRLPLTRTTSQMVEAFTYSTSGLLLQYSQTDVLLGSADNGKVRTWVYTYTTLASGLQVLTSVDGPGLLANSVTDVTTYAYDANGNMVSETNPNGHTTQYLNLNAAGQPTLIIQPNTIEWALSYDIMGRVTSATLDPSGAAQTTTMAYDVTGQLVSYANFNGKTWSFEYNEAKRLVETVDPEGDTANYTYDALGDLTNVTYSNATGEATATDFYEDMQYDALGRILQTNGANGQISTFSHDVEDNLTTMIDPLNNPSAFVFDKLNRLTSTTDRAGYTTTQSFDDADQRVSFTDPRSINTGFSYNGFGDLLSEVSADRGTLSYTYNDRGLVVSMTDGNGVLSTYEYDNAGRLKAHRFPSEPSQDQVFTYDLTGGNPYGIGQLSKVVDESGKFRLRHTDNGSINRDRRFINGVRYEIEYEFDDNGNMIWIEYPSNRRIRYYYNDADRTKGVWHQMRVIDQNTGTYPPLEMIVANAQYEPLGPLHQFRYGDGVFHREYHDSSHRLTRIIDQELPISINLRDVSYSWTNRDNLASVTDVLNASSNETYQYSARELLSHATGPWETLDYTYDAVGNRSSRVETIGGIPTLTEDYAYPLLNNRLDTISEASTPMRSFTYDGAGNVISEDRDGDIYTYSYNAANRLKAVRLNGALQGQYKYNALGQQVWRKLHPSGQIIHSLFDLDGNRIAEYDYAGGSSTLIREYIWMNGLPVAVVENGVIYYVRTDHIGRPVFATDSVGTKVWEATYYPFGEVHATGLPGTPINLRFPGQWFQMESGLHQNWMRDYDPTTGRYMQADPLGLVDGASVYGYARQNPGRYVDPRGEFALPLIPYAVAGVVAIVCYYYCEPVFEACSMLIDDIDDMVFPPNILPASNRPPSDAHDPNGAKAPGKPGIDEGFEDPAGGEQWAPNPNGSGNGWKDRDGNVWVPTGNGGRAHGGPHWDVQKPRGGGYTNVYPGGSRR